ncbi:hypothetical protein KP509_14G070400 [Ceratopteris richardii]|uniref:Uncharacterized protein n=1 Tax=Ceratopteris richardii TaxID=49495 RepID=A0A8T2TB67_CERRI|nr:hypothetical protein KP509_14G070400 [Ceratopteris richardii]KAH7415998.1 hypothetical protein KP509_14G070400 [Ceratopteris richardii]
MGNPGSACDSDGDGSEENSMRPDIIDGFERKSVALLDYVNNLEAQLEQLTASFEHKESRMKAEKKALEDEFSQRETKLKSEKRNLEDKLHHVMEQVSRAQKALVHEERKRIAADEAVRSLKLDARAAQDLIHNERQRVKELEQQVSDLKEQLRNREQAYNRKRLKDERHRSRLEEDMSVLKKKVTLGWILGCLTEVYLRPENDSEPAKLESIEREVRRLVNGHDMDDCMTKKCRLPSPRQARPDDSVSRRATDLDMDSEATRDILPSSETCKPCRYIRSVMETEHDHHHHHHHSRRSRSASPISSGCK